MRHGGIRKGARLFLLATLPILLFLLLTVRTLPAVAAAEKPTNLRPVRLQLKWHHQFQFAGYYAAEVKGFYRQEGLAVHLIEGDTERYPVQEVLEGRADFGVTDADILTVYLEGKPVVALATLFQHSPYILLSRADAGIRTPSDLRGRSVMMQDEQGIAQIKAVFHREGIPLSAVRVLQHSWDLQDLIDGKVDAQSAYSTVEPFLMRARGVAPSMIRATDYGVDFYGDTLFTTRDTVAKRPEVVAAFRRATLKGWDYAMNNPEEMVNLIAGMPGVADRGVTPEQLRFEAKAMRELILPGLVEIGHMNPGRWEAMAKVYASIGLIPKAPEHLEGFIYDPNAVPSNRWLLPTAVAAAAVAVAGLIVLIWNLQLRRVVAYRTRELAQASQAKDNFLAVLSHELRTPLTPVLTTVALLRDRPHQVGNLQETYEMIHRNVELEARLIDDLLDVTRIAKGKVELNKRPVSLGTILNRAVEVCRSDLDARQLRFEMEVPEEALWVSADEARLQQVFWNLLQNAIKFTPHDGRVGIRCRRESAACAVAEVWDCGIGIAPEALGAIFNPFEQGGVGTTRQFGGLGLGLTISKALVEMHGGTIEAHSAGRGQGASFRVRLPLVAATAAAAARPVAAARPAQGLQILLVEDHEDTARVMRQLLRLEGHQVERAADVATALTLARQKPFDLLISDLGLPDGSGLELLRDLRARGWKTPAIALSGYGQEEDIRQSQEAGFALHLTKPTNPERLAQAIAQVTRQEAGVGVPASV